MGEGRVMTITQTVDARYPRIKQPSRGVRFFGDGKRTTSVIMQARPHQIRFIDSTQVYATKNAKTRF